MYLCAASKKQNLGHYLTKWHALTLNPSSLTNEISAYCLHGPTCKWSYILFVLSIFSHHSLHFLETFKDSNSNLVFLFVTEPINKINHKFKMRIITSDSSCILNAVSQIQRVLSVKSTTHPVCTAFAYVIELTTFRTLSDVRP